MDMKKLSFSGFVGMVAMCFGSGSLLLLYLFPSFPLVQIDVVKISYSQSGYCIDSLFVWREVFIVFVLLAPTPVLLPRRSDISIVCSCFRTIRSPLSSPLKS